MTLDNKMAPLIFKVDIKTEIWFKHHLFMSANRVFEEGTVSIEPYETRNKRTWFTF